MIKVYFENANGQYAELAATFESEKVYDACFPQLEKLALENGFDYVTESVENDDENSEIENLIIEKAKEIIKSDFMQYPDYDEEIPFSFLDAMTVILSQSLEDIESSEIYDFLQSKFKN